MRKLKNKVFSVIFAILTIFVLSILSILNFQNYQQKASDIKSNLMMMDDNKDKEFDKIQETSEMIKDDKPLEETKSKVFMDVTIYTAILDKDLNVVDVINHTTNNMTDDQIKELAEKIIKDEEKTNLKVGNLYFANYSYAFSKNNNSLTIIDNTDVKEKLMQTLKTSILIFIAVEIIIVIISKKITSWIIRPVIESFNKQKQFVADASHELKTPLSVIIASSEALENEPEEKKWLTNIKSESERMNNLISDLLDMAKSEHDEREQYVKENLSKLVERSILTFESLIYEKDIKLNYKIEEDIKFLCNSNQIKQVIGILIDNAIKHSYAKGEIKIELKKEKGNIVFAVTNKGEEIPKEEREKIFERFYRVDESRNRNENRYGLGLAIAKNIVTNHNGKIIAMSENGYTTFKITFKNIY